MDFYAHVQGRHGTLRKDDLQRGLSIIAQQKAFANGGSQLEKVSLFIPSSFLGNCCRRRPGLDLLNVLTFDRPHIGHFDCGLQSVLMEPLYCAGMRVKSRNLWGYDTDDTNNTDDADDTDDTGQIRLLTAWQGQGHWHGHDRRPVKLGLFMHNSATGNISAKHTTRTQHTSSYNRYCFVYSSIAFIDWLILELSLEFYFSKEIVSFGARLDCETLCMKKLEMISSY